MCYSLLLGRSITVVSTHVNQFMQSLNLLNCVQQISFQRSGSHCVPPEHRAIG